MHSKQIGTFYAKTHFSQILADVINGEEYIVTRRGKQVAVISPLLERKKENEIDLAIQTIHELRKGVKLGKDITIKQLIEEGRR